MYSVEEFIDSDGTIEVFHIVIGTRVREDMGDLNELARSISTVGLIHPIAITDQGLLVAGARRLAAMTEVLGWATVPVRVVRDIHDMVTALRAEMHENTQRLDLSPFEYGQRGLMIEERVRQLQSERKLSSANFAENGGPDPTLLGLDPEPQTTLLVDSEPLDPNEEQEIRALSEMLAETSGSLTVKVARYLGKSPTTYSKARDVVVAAQDDPERYGDLAMALHTERNVAGTYRHYENRKENFLKQDLAEAPPDRRPPLEDAPVSEWISRIPAASADLIVAEPPAIAGLSRDAYSARQLQTNSWLYSAMASLKSSGHMYIFLRPIPEYVAHYIAEVQLYVLQAMDIRLSDMFVWSWRNVTGAPPQSGYRDSYEIVLHLTGRWASQLASGSLVEQLGVQEIPAPVLNAGNYIELPFELASRIIRMTTKEGGTIVNPYAAGGVFVIAAHKLGRSIQACEESIPRLREAESKGCRIVTTESRPTATVTGSQIGYATRFSTLDGKESAGDLVEDWKDIPAPVNDFRLPQGWLESVRADIGFSVGFDKGKD